MAEVEGFDSHRLRDVIQLEYVEHTVRVFSSLQRGVSARCCEHLLQLKVERGGDLQAHAKVFADFVFTAPPSPKSTTLRFIVRDSGTGRMGSVDLPLKP